MEHPFFPTTTTRADALRFLTISEKLLTTRDLHGTKSFATRARDSDPTLTHAELILAVADTLIAGDRRIGPNNLHDWYSILRLNPNSPLEAVASQYRNLALLLNPQTNNFPFADQAFRLVVDAWGVLSNPGLKSMYDKELNFYLYNSHHQQPDPFGNTTTTTNNNNPFPGMHQNFMFFGASGSTSSSSGTHFVNPPQVHANPPHVHQVEHIGMVGSTREPQNFMGFNPGGNPFFGSRPSHDMFNKHVQDNYPTTTAFSVGVGSGSGNNVGNNTNNVGNSSHDHDQRLQQNYSNIFGDNVNVSEGVVEEEGVEEDEGDVEGIDEEEGVEGEGNDDGSAFWTACPYCYYMYQYPNVYVDCTLRCRNCESAFQAVVIPSPPPVVDGQEVYFCCWGFMPFGFSKTLWRRNYGRRSTPRVYIDDYVEDVFVDISDSSESDDDDWHRGSEKRKKKVMKNVRGKGNGGTTHRSAKKAQGDVRNDKDVNVNVQDGVLPADDGVEKQTSTPTLVPNRTSGAALNARKQPKRVVKSFGKLDLNVECSNEGEETTSQRVNQENGINSGEDDNIEGIGFFEGLDEYFSNLPILNVVGDDRVVEAA